MLTAMYISYLITFLKPVLTATVCEVSVSRIMFMLLILCLILPLNNGHFMLGANNFDKMYFAYYWKQLGYDFNGIKYLNDTEQRWTPDGIYFPDEMQDRNIFFNQYNNVPIGLEIYESRMFVTVPRRRFGIPSTLNYIDLVKDSNRSPLLKPYPDVDSVSSFVSVYRPRVDACSRLWMVDTGLLEVPNNREQLKQPEVIVFDLKTDREILRYQLKPSDLSNGTTSGFISIAVDVDANTCEDAHAYISDLATGGLVVFSMRKRDSWRFSHPSMNYDPTTTFTLHGFNINWKDGIFSMALSEPDARGIRTAYYHPFISTQEFSITTDILKNENGDFGRYFKMVGYRGPLSQSAAHVYHSPTRTLLFANIAKDGILCWNIDKPLTPKNTALVAEHPRFLGYISDIKLNGDEVYVLVNQMHLFIFSKLDTTTNNFFILGAKVADLIKGTVCEGYARRSPNSEPQKNSKLNYYFYNNENNMTPAV